MVLPYLQNMPLYAPMEYPKNVIAQRLRGAREAAGLSLAEAASQLQLEPDRYAALEEGTSQPSIALITEAARLYGVEASAILTGGDAHARLFSITRKGRGAVVSRRDCYHYEHLAAGFSQPAIEPFLVTVHPKEERTTPQNSHSGQEFNLMLSGRLELTINGHVVTLATGDSIYFDASKPHGMRALDDAPATFLAIVTP